jgi:hypothetical protein
MELRTQFTSFGVDLRNPDDFYVVWTTITLLISNSCRIQGADAREVLNTIYAAIAAAVPDELRSEQPE